MKYTPTPFIYRLISHIAESRHSMIREAWNHHLENNSSGFTSWQKSHHELMSRQITRIRGELFRLICDSRLQEGHPIISEILAEDTIELKKSCMIMLLLGFDKRTIADLHCISTLYIDFLYDEFPEYFK